MVEAPLTDDLTPPLRHKDSLRYTTTTITKAAIE
jgi:hypothetical protein